MLEQIIAALLSKTNTCNDVLGLTQQMVQERLFTAPLFLRTKKAEHVVAKCELPTNAFLSSCWWDWKLKLAFASERSGGHLKTNKNV